MITYPVSPTARFTFKLRGDVRRGRFWPRADGMQLADMDPDLIILEESAAVIPTFDSATQRLDNGTWVDDQANQSAIFTYSVVQLTQTELDALTDANDRNQKKILVAQAIPTLRTWAEQTATITVTSGNAVTVLQQTVDHLSIFFARFADLLEALYIDKT